MSVIIRHSAPGKLDHAPFGSSCKVIHADNTYDLYMQYSHDEEEPRWESMGVFSESSLDTKDYDKIVNID